MSQQRAPAEKASFNADPAAASIRPRSAVGAEPCAVRLLDPASVARWNEFVVAHPEGTFFHRGEWAEVLSKAFRHRPHYLLAESGGRVRGVLPLAEVRSMLFGKVLISTPFCVYGGVLAADGDAQRALVDAACALARDLGVDYLEMRNRRPQNVDWPSKDLYVTFRRPIAGGAEENMQAIPRKQRAMVRKGIQKQLRVDVDRDAGRMYAIYSESLRNLGTPVFARRYVDTLLATFGADCEILTISDDKQAVASVLSFYFRDEVLPYYGGSVLAARAVAGNDFMYWQVMERAREKGMRIFDFGRSKRGTGSFDFKSHWGFEPEPLSYEYFLVRARSLPNLSPTNAKYRALIDTWRKLPVGVSRLIGPPLARYLG